MDALFYNSISLPPGQPLGPRRLSLKPVPKLPNMEAFLREAQVKVKRQARGFLAPELCFQAVQAATERPFAEGVRRERELFQVLLSSGQAQALQYAFFAERAVHRWATPGGASWSSAAPQPVRRAGVIGEHGDRRDGDWAQPRAGLGVPCGHSHPSHPSVKLSPHWEAPKSDGNSHATRLAPPFPHFRGSFVCGP